VVYTYKISYVNGFVGNKKTMYLKEKVT